VPIPEYIQKLRSHIGTDLLLIPAVTAVVLDGRRRVLLLRRADTGRWALPGGIMEPGEEVAESVVREVLEETSVRVRPERITGVYTHAGVVHHNGDRSCYVVTGFRCSVVEGEPRVNDDESLEVAWSALDDLPPLDPTQQELLDDALREDPVAAFRRLPPSAVPPAEAEASAEGPYRG
jgi:8-oxo-dGTP diphosphatase